MPFANGKESDLQRLSYTTNYKEAAERTAASLLGL
jgi:hypothetical protein